MGLRVEIGDFHVHDVAGIFKVRKWWKLFPCVLINSCLQIWFRQLPSSVIPRPLLQDFLATSAIDDPEKRAAALKVELLFFFQSSILTQE